jgi:hypothetical protein
MSQGGSSGWGMPTTSQEASPGWVGAPRPAGEERGMPVRYGKGEPVVKTGEGAAASLPVNRRQYGVDNMQEGGAFYTRAHRERVPGWLGCGV